MSLPNSTLNFLGLKAISPHRFLLLLLLPGLFFTACTLNVDDKKPERQDSSYVRDEEGIRYRYPALENEGYETFLVEGADDESFTIINGLFAKDNRNVFYRGKKIYGADPESFRALKKGFSVDKNNFYYQATQINGAGGLYSEFIDFNSFDAIDEQVIRDKRNVFWITNYTMKKLDVEDPASFQVLSSFFGKDKKHVYYFLNTFQTLEGVDPETFEVINYEFIKDKNAVYRLNAQQGLEKLEKMNPKTFKVIDRFYVGDDKNIYLISYNDLLLIEGADINTFEAINDSFARDKNNIYFKLKKLEGALAGSFRILSSFYAKDKQSVYYYDYRWAKKLENADPDSFTILKNFYSKDKNSAYYQHYKIEGADPETFEAIPTSTGYYAKDKNNYYEMWKKTEKNPTQKIDLNELLKDPSVDKKAVEEFMKENNLDKEMVEDYIIPYTDEATLKELIKQYSNQQTTKKSSSSIRFFSQ